MQRILIIMVSLFTGKYYGSTTVLKFLRAGDAIFSCTLAENSKRGLITFIVTLLTSALLIPCGMCLPTEKTEEHESIAAKARQSLVVINTNSGTGTGFVVNYRNKKVVMTNHHVILEDLNEDFMKNVNILTRSGENLRPARLFIAQDRDIAYFEIEDNELPALTMAEEVDKISHQSEIVALGNAAGQGVINEKNGKIAGAGPLEIEVTATLEPGNSGGPVILKDTGEVVGISTRLQSKVEVTGTTTKQAEIYGRFDVYTMTTTSVNTKISYRYFATRIDNISDDFEEYDSKVYAYDGLMYEQLKNSVVITAVFLKMFSNLIVEDLDRYLPTEKQRYLRICQLHKELPLSLYDRIPDLKPIITKWNRRYHENERMLRSKRSAHRASKRFSMETSSQSGSKKGLPGFSWAEPTVTNTCNLRTYYFILRNDIVPQILKWRRMYDQRPFHYQYFKREGEKLMEEGRHLAVDYQKLLVNLEKQLE